jgi:RNA polymerase sigma-70 factor, ECF subfamily
VTTPRGNQALPSRAAVETSASEAQFQHMYQENQRVLFRSVYSWVGNREDAEDLTADIFLKAVSGVDYARPPKMIRRWLFQVARTTLIDHWRARDRLVTSSLEALLARGEREPTEDEADLRHSTRDDRLQLLLRPRLTLPPSPEEGFDEHEHGDEPADEHLAAEDMSAQARVGRLLEALPARYRDVLTCRFLLNLSIRDTACRLELTETHVKVIQLRALKRAALLEVGVSDDERPSAHED